MQNKSFSKLLLLPIIFVIFLYSNILSNSLKYEHQRSLFSGAFHSENINRPILVSKSIKGQSVPAQNILTNPSQVELYLRASLINNSRGVQNDVIEIKELYQNLLFSRPTWPYLYSGLAQINLINSEELLENVNTAIKYGPHEHKVINSLAEIVFYNWNNFNLSVQSTLLKFLSNQPDIIINKVVKISARFGRLYEFCDYLYDNHHKEFSSCKMNYWQPLLDS